jgi:hypothetical protein
VRLVVAALSWAIAGCSLTTSLDGVFAEPGDATVETGSIAFDAGENDGLIFPTEDTAPPPCGAKAQMCCEGKCNAGLVCISDSLCGDPPPCGADTQPCCGGSACNSGLECQTGTCKPGTPPKCGASGEMCCTGGACVAGLVCTGTSCVACGGSGQACCGGASCGGGLVCSGGKCAPCGGSRQPCCLGSICGGGLWCGSGACQPLCYLRCCDGSLQTTKVYSEAECRNSYPVCADRGKTLRIQYEGRYIYTRDTPC